jgi:uncharacterized membrane protein YhaH (DUF805 family)
MPNDPKTYAIALFSIVRTTLQTILHPWLQFWNFKGRTGALEFTIFLIASSAAQMLLMMRMVTASFGVADPTQIAHGAQPEIDPILINATLFASVALLMPIPALIARRLHDHNLRAYWMLLLLIPVVGQVAVLAMAIGGCIPAKNKTNRFGDASVNKLSFSYYKAAILLDLDKYRR